jgi:hypothetical protein
VRARDKVLAAVEEVAPRHPAGGLTFPVDDRIERVGRRVVQAQRRSGGRQIVQPDTGDEGLVRERRPAVAIGTRPAGRGIPAVSGSRDGELAVCDGRIAPQREARPVPGQLCAGGIRERPMSDELCGRRRRRHGDRSDVVVVAVAAARRRG